MVDEVNISEDAVQVITQATQGDVPVPQEPVGTVALCSWDLNTPEGRDRMANLIVGERKSIPDLGPEEVRIQDIAVYWDDADIDGEIVRRLYLAMISPDGVVIRTGSSVVIKQIHSLMSKGLYGPAPWSPPIRVTFAERKSKIPGRRYLTIAHISGSADNGQRGNDPGRSVPTGRGEGVGGVQRSTTGRRKRNDDRNDEAGVVGDSQGSVASSSPGALGA